MKKQFQNSRYKVRFVKRFPVALPAAKVNLFEWVTQMLPTDYASYSTAHQAMGSHWEGDRFFMVNVENIGNEMLVQHYELMEQRKNYVRFYSPDTTAYLMRWIPVKVGVPWEMMIVAKSDKTSELICTIGADFPNLLVKIGAWFNGLAGYYLRKHLREEGIAFAKDIEKRYNVA